MTTKRDLLSLHKVVSEGAPADNSKHCFAIRTVNDPRFVAQPGNSFNFLSS